MHHSLFLSGRQAFAPTKDRKSPELIPIASVRKAKGPETPVPASYFPAGQSFFCCIPVKQTGMSAENKRKVFKKPRKHRLLYRLESEMEIPMFLLSLFWLYLLIVDLAKGLSSVQEAIFYIVWIIFILEYLAKLLLASDKLNYIKSNLITLLALVIPAFRVLRIFYALRLLRSATFISSTNVVRALTSGRRFLSALKEAQGPTPSPEMNIGVLIEFGKIQNEISLLAFSRQLVRDVEEELEEATGLRWNFNFTDPSQLPTDNTRRPSDFLDDATLRMAEGPYDLMLVITDVALASQKNRVEAGFTSIVSRNVIISTRKLIMTGRNKPMFSLEDEAVRLNAAALLLRLVGTIMGLRRRNDSPVMRPFFFQEDRQKIPRFTQSEADQLQRIKDRLPERELRGGSTLETFIFHLLMAFRHPKELLRPLIRNKALFLPLSLPRLVTAAVSPSFILLFTAEIWDVGLHMDNSVAIIFPAITIMAGSFYLVSIQALFLPRKEKRVLTEHLAVANTVIYISIFLACIGLFLMVGLLMLFMETYVFPTDLIQTWPTLNKPGVTLLDKIRLAAFISTVGVTTGALAGGFESREMIQNLALFENRS